MSKEVFVNRAPPYSDLDLDFIKHPTTSDVVILKGEAAVKRSIRNLIFTNYYDRPFRSYIGSNVRGSLFENFDPFTTDTLKMAIENVIKNFEPRVTLLGVEVAADMDRNGFNVQLYYVIKNREQPIITSIFLERIR